MSALEKNKALSQHYCTRITWDGRAGCVPSRKGKGARKQYKDCQRKHWVSLGCSKRVQKIAQLAWEERKLAKIMLWHGHNHSFALSFFYFICFSLLAIFPLVSSSSFPLCYLYLLLLLLVDFSTSSGFYFFSCNDVIKTEFDTSIGCFGCCF